MEIDKDKLWLQSLRPSVKKLKNLYRYLDQDFPTYERIPYALLCAALKKGTLQAYFLTDGLTHYGYAICQRVERYGLLHILYVAVLADYRSAGLGGLMLEKLGEKAEKGILLDVEDPAAALDPEQLNTRIRRIAFYERNGFHIDPRFAFVNFGFSMLVMANTPLPDLGPHWLAFYRRLYSHAYGFRLGGYFIWPAKHRGCV